MLNPEAMAEREFTKGAINFVLPKENKENIFAKSWYRGAPGWCPVCKPYAVKINSPLSQKATVG